MTKGGNVWPYHGRPICTQPYATLSMHIISSLSHLVKRSNISFLLDFFLSRLPAKPYCTNTLGAMAILPRDLASSRGYIQPNNPNDLTWFVYDVDRSSALYDWDDFHAPPPNLAVVNPRNGHAHLLYGLCVPVHTQITANIGPIRFAASVDAALCAVLRADSSYSGLLCHNPLSDAWWVYSYQSSLYDLSWLADYVDLPPSSIRRGVEQTTPLGRNCALFDDLRRYAYSAVRDPLYASDLQSFIAHLYGFALARNRALFHVPLQAREVYGIAKSIGTWCIRNLSSTGFDQWARARRTKSAGVRSDSAAQRYADISAAKAAHPDLSNRALARLLGVGEITVRRALAHYAKLD